eukprot:scaffold143_cov364-Pavlova_lutheri.AAC.7
MPSIQSLSGTPSIPTLPSCLGMRHATLCCRGILALSLRGDLVIVGKRCSMACRMRFCHTFFLLACNSKRLGRVSRIACPLHPKQSLGAHYCFGLYDVTFLSLMQQARRQASHA